MLLLTISENSTNIRQFKTQQDAEKYMISLYPDAILIASHNNIRVFESPKKRTTLELIDVCSISLDTLIPGGYLNTTTSADFSYPGVDVEYIPDNISDYPQGAVLPRVCIEKPIETKELSAYIWADCYHEDYTHKITLSSEISNEK